MNVTLSELHRVCDYAGDGAEFKPEWEYVRNDVDHEKGSPKIYE